MTRVAAVLVALVVVFGAGVLVGRATLGGPTQQPTVDADAAALAPGSQGDAVPLGRAAPVGPWEVVVRDFDGDATERVLAANQFNVEPPADHVYAVLEAGLTRRSPGPGVLSGSLRPALVTPGGTEYPLGVECGVLPTPVDPERILAQGEHMAGTWCWVLPQPEVPKVTLRVDGTGGGAVWFELR